MCIGVFIFLIGLLFSSCISFLENLRHQKVILKLTDLYLKNPAENMNLFIVNRIFVSAMELVKVCEVLSKWITKVDYLRACTPNISCRLILKFQ